METNGKRTLPTLEAVRVTGFRALADTGVSLRQLNVIIGPNATGKTSLIDLLSLWSEVAGGPITGRIGARGGLTSILWNGGDDAFVANLAMRTRSDPPGPRPYHLTLKVGAEGGAPVVVAEGLGDYLVSHGEPDFLEPLYVRRGAVAHLFFPGGEDIRESRADLDPAELLLSSLRDPKAYPLLSTIREYLADWRFYLGFDVSPGASIRRPYQLGSSPTRDQYLAPDGSNLAGVVAGLRASASHSDEFAQLEEWCRLGFPEFQALGATRGVTGADVILDWREYGRDPLHAGQLSDGVLRFLCLAVLAASPNPPPLVAIDEPELGLHPRLLPLTAAVLRTLAERTQVILITHSPRFLGSGFPLESILVSSKDEHGCHFHRPADNQQLQQLLKPTIGETIETLYETGELELPPEEPRTEPAAEATQ